MSDSEFWRFSLALYSQPDAAQACMLWQDRAGADVNVLLYVLFLASRGFEVDAAALARIAGTTEPWRKQVVAPLRSVRRALKSAIGSFQPQVTADLRNEVARVELAAEQIEQETLEQLIPSSSLNPGAADPVSLARANLDTYSRLHCPAPETVLEQLLDAYARHACGHTRG